MFKGSMTFETPMLFSIAFVVLFTMGGFTGRCWPSRLLTSSISDTYFVVAHFHYVLVPGDFLHHGGDLLLAAEVDRQHVDETLGKLHFWLSFVGINILFFPQHFLGLAGMPRRIPDYALPFRQPKYGASSLGAFIFGFSQLLLLFIVVKTVMGAKATAEVWEGSSRAGMDCAVPCSIPTRSRRTSVGS